MRLPHYLNPLRGTRFVWLIPFIWAILKFAAMAAPSTVEVFLHHRFGARCGKALLKGFLLLSVLTVISTQSEPSNVGRLFPHFLFDYSILATGHWLTSRGQRPAEHVYSYLHGEPWPFWSSVPVSTAIVQRYVEPVLCCLVGSAVSHFDTSLGSWILLAGIALFVKEQVIRARLRTRQLDALDNRVETERMAPRPQVENEEFVDAGPATPRPHRRGPGNPYEP
jgi:hypothetical protein